MRTKRMPDDQGELRHLFTFLAELHQSSLTPIGIEEFSHPDEDFAVLFADAALDTSPGSQSTGLRGHPCGGSSGRLACIARSISRSPHCNAVVVLLLCYSGGSGSCLSLGMLLSGEGGVLRMMLVLVLLLLMVLSLMVLLLLLLLLLLVQPGRFSLRVLVLVREDVLGLSLQHGFGLLGGGT
jgi:hypothetical protein